ncbi:MAG: FAD-dependent thymidylate synthase [Candidatus Caldarchaeum sp.]
MVQLTLHSYGPRASFVLGETSVEVGPDVFIAAEGAGTFEGVSVEKKIAKLVADGKNLTKTAEKIHRESTRRGHASMTTSLHLQMEGTEISRALSMLLVAPPFGSYLQESQRRAPVTRSSLIIPRFEVEKHRKIFAETAEALVDTYADLVKMGIELEDARYVLPICVKTSLFISCSFENYVAFLQLAEQSRKYVPDEIHEFAEKLKQVLSEIAPIMTRSRMWFQNRLTTYPFPNPFKPRDMFFEKILDGRFVDEPVLLSVHGDLAGFRLAELFSSEQKEELDSVNPLVYAVFLEPMSLVAYHQAIRHRTVETAVESIYQAAARAVQDKAKNVVTPPSIKKSSDTNDVFNAAVGTALQTYNELIQDGCQPSKAVMILPQALKIHVIRGYNGFNLMHPSGFVATRTCSYAQWEERAIAYKILYEAMKKIPGLGEVAGEKCRQLGFCPEKSWCPIILKYHLYDDETHQRFWKFD